MEILSCMCRGCGGIWDRKEYPFVRQGVMHSPVGCIRRELADWELQDLYSELTGFEYPDDDQMVLFQAVMNNLVLHPEIAGKYPVILTPVPVIPYKPPLEITPETQKKPRGRTLGTVASKPREIVVVNPGPIKPPWIK